MKYNYNEKLEAFVREDGHGKKYWINVVEAQRIMTLYKLGCSIGEIRGKIRFNNNKRVSESTVENFIRNVQDKNITIPKTNVIMPLEEDLSIEARIERLEHDIDYFKTYYLQNSSSDESQIGWKKKIRNIFRI